MISVEDAQQRLIAMIAPLGAEQIAISEALGRVLAEDVIARRTQPPWAVSAMDGYAARAADVASVPARLKVVGAVPAGQAHAGSGHYRAGGGNFTRPPGTHSRRRHGS